MHHKVNRSFDGLFHKFVGLAHLLIELFGLGPCYLGDLVAICGFSLLG
jgi:hypothetical protein